MKSIKNVEERNCVDRIENLYGKIYERTEAILHKIEKCPDSGGSRD